MSAGPNKPPLSNIVRLGQHEVFLPSFDSVQLFLYNDLSLDGKPPAKDTTIVNRSDSDSDC